MPILTKDSIGLLDKKVGEGSDERPLERKSRRAKELLYKPSTERRFTTRDSEWLKYLSNLTPDDPDGAFLLSEELPDEMSDPSKIINAILTSTHRAFGTGRRFRIIDYVRGKISGLMKVLIPQGSQRTYHFNNEVGWKATVIMDDEKGTKVFKAYYKQICMNPVNLIQDGGELDTSEVDFKPIGKGESEQISQDPLLEFIIRVNMLRLQEQYNSLSQRIK